MKDAIQKYQLHREVADRSKTCHAPFQSLYFGQTGKVVACCYNREYVLGEYPQMSIGDIWRGETATKLREEVESMDSLPMGCQICASQLLAGNFAGLHAAKYDKFADSPAALRRARNREASTGVGYPKLMEFELSNSCNLECVMCHGGFSSTIRKNRENLAPLPDPFDDAYVEQLAEFIPHLEEAKFLGGEPFLVGIYYKIWDKMIELNPECVTSITTNGSILNPRVRRVLEKLNCQMVMSIDSIVRETYDKIRRNSDFDQVQESIAYYLEICEKQNRQLAFATCPMTINWREIPDITNYCNDNNISLFVNTVVYPRFVSLRFLPSNQLKEILGFYEKAEIRGSGGVQEFNKGGFRHFVSQIAAWYREAVEREGTQATGDSEYAWKCKTREEIRKEHGIADCIGIVKAAFWNDGPGEAGEAIREYRDQSYDDYCFMRNFLYGSFVAYTDEVEMDGEAQAELRIKTEFMLESWENYSDRVAFIERLADTNVRELFANLAEVDADQHRLTPMMVFPKKEKAEAA